ncbi:MAG: lipoyl(octanoyl) transferase [Acidobacteriia bacterium]|nr:lipoyl(octanoyl) transferase [Terriglobia bacterium]
MISVVQLGTLNYQEGLRLQQRLIELRKSGQIGDVLLLLEHAPVITLGRNAKAANVLASTEVLAARGVEVFECNRGGDVTFHGPGQLVGYPIIDLREHDLRGHELLPLDGDLRSRSSADRIARATQPRKTLGAVDYVRRLEEVLIRTCADFGIPARRIAGLTGVWTGIASGEARVGTGSVGTGAPARPGESKTRPAAEAKIAAIGVHISRAVTSHGFALNVNTDLSYFNLIVPCGITAKPVTSMARELGREPDLDKVARALSQNFGSVFGSQMLWVETIDALLGNSVGVPMKAPTELRRLRGEDDLSLA